MVKSSFQSRRGFWYFMVFEIEMYAFRKRWLLVLPLALFLAYIVSGTVLAYSDNNHLAGNTWDIMFSVFGNGNIVFYVLNLFLLFLISDLSLETKFGEWVLLRLCSRKKWWIGKMLLLAMSVLFYLAVLVIVIAAISSFVLPWQGMWSEKAIGNPLEAFLTPQMTAISPLSVFLQLLILLAFGWFSLGLTTMVFVRLFNHALAGFSLGMFVNICGILALKGYLVDVPYPYNLLFIDTHLLINMHNFGKSPSPYPSFFASILYWVGWIALFGVWGFAFGSRKDFLPPQHHLDE